MPKPYEKLKIDPGAPTPIASQLASQLEWLVASGQIGANEQLPSIRVLAEQLGINLHTVRAAYHQLDRTGLARVRRGRGTIILGYDREKLANAAPDVPTFTIGVLVPSYSPFYTPFLDAVEASAEEDPLMFLVCNTQDSAARAARWLDQLLSKSVDGILVASRGLPNGRAPEDSWEFADGFPPVVFVDIPDSPEPRVLLDHYAGGQLIAQHMLGHGYHHPAVITPPLEWSNVAEIFNGFQHTYSGAGHALDPSSIIQVDDFRTESGRRAANRLLATAALPDAIFAAGDYLAVGALQSLAAHDLRAPRDLGLLGYGDVELSELVDPPLTTAVLDAAGMGTAAMEMLRNRMAGIDPEPEVRLSVGLKVRASCGCRP